jgi:nucleoside-diphosphate-sugar epimerase
MGDWAMETMTERVLVIGGPGNISTGTIEDLLTRGCSVGVFSHREEPAKALSPSIETFAGDRDHPEELGQAIARFRPDAVVDFVCFVPAQAEQIVALLYGKVRQYIFVSTVDIYGRPQSRIPLRESDPWLMPPSQYAIDKLACERILLARADREHFPLTIARPSYSYGPRYLISFFSRRRAASACPPACRPAGAGSRRRHYPASLRLRARRRSHDRGDGRRACRCWQ